MKRTWDWHAPACILELGNRLKEEKAARVIATELKGLFDKAPTHSAIIAQLRRSSLPLALERVFGVDAARVVLEEFHARALHKESEDAREKRVPKRESVKRVSKSAPSVAGEPVPSLEGTPAKPVPRGPREPVLREDSDPEEYLMRFHEIQAAQGSRLRMCRGKDDTCLNRPRGGPYCEECGKDLYQAPAGRRSSVRDLERVVRRGQNYQ